jgi:hypothetical protein
MTRLDAVLRSLVAALVVLGSLVVATPTTATINCPAGKVCLWAGEFATQEQINVSDRKGVSNKVGDKMNNQASSVENDTDYAVFLYDKRNARGERICIEPTGTVVNQLSALTFDNVTSSTKVTRKEACPL